MLRIVTKDDVDKVLKMYYNKRTKAMYGSAMRHFVGKRLALEDIQPIVMAWGHLSSSTINQRRSALSVLVKTMGKDAEHDLMNNLAFPKGRPPKRRKSIPDDKVRKIIESVATTRERLLVTILLHTGMRIGSIRLLTYSQLKSESFEIIGKGDRQVEIVTTPTLREIISAAMVASGSSESDYVFRTPGGKPVCEKTLPRTLKTLIKRAGFEEAGITAHNFRHTYATSLARDGVGLASISELMGHKNVSTTALYVHPDKDSLQKAAELATGRWA